MKLSVPEIAKRYPVGRNTVIRRIADGTLPATNTRPDAKRPWWLVEESDAEALFANYERKRGKGKGITIAKSRTTRKYIERAYPPLPPLDVNDPPIREDGMCVVCGKSRPEIAVSESDPFCSNKCCRRHHDVKSHFDNERDEAAA